MKNINPFKKSETMQNCNSSESMCGMYFFGLIGAAVYFISKATTFGAGVIGFLKALVWPIYLVHGVFTHLEI